MLGRPIKVESKDTKRPKTVINKFEFRALLDIKSTFFSNLYKSIYFKQQLTYLT